MTDKTSNPIELKIGPDRYLGWQSMRVSRSIETMAGSFSLDVTDYWSQGGGGAITGKPILPGDACQVLLHGQPVITGFVDEAAIDYDSNSHRTKISGRDKTMDIVDCSLRHPPGQWNNKKLDELAMHLVHHHGIKLVVQADDVGKPFDTIMVQTGETMFAFLDRAARSRGLMFSSTPDGDLLLTTPGQITLTDHLVEGVNIKAARAQFSHKDRYSEIRVIGQTRLEGDGDSDYASPSVVVRDPSITRYRPLVIHSEISGTTVDFKARAEWEVMVRAARGSKGSITVQGWTDQSGKIWQPGRIVTVTSPSIYLDRAKMLIVGCDYSQDLSGGSLTELSICPPAAFVELGSSSKRKSRQPIPASKVFGTSKSRAERLRAESVSDWSDL
ncbi:MAG: contractile injection system protein, VgrG/Pvc8 family [Candidatus Pacebacteria bacterium]|nr:contractile injection system protein, VgrG/Pvc8 family [Candidatus Paceibacterota bacterium]